MDIVKASDVWWAGYDAYMDAKLERDNPYEWSFMAYYDWLAGWHYAKQKYFDGDFD